ncbi:MAG: hypothetical protein HQL07_09705 [Nitrospirae bacterium]|nr:hypothetical protein [Magnetococcales bacterium]
MNNSIRFDWPVFGTGKFQFVLFLIGLTVFSFHIIFLTVVPDTKRIFFPNKPDFNVNYTYKSAILSECFFQKCPALIDARDHVNHSDSVKDKELVAGTFLTEYTHLFSFIVIAVKKIFSFSWLDSYHSVRIFFSVVIPGGFAYLLYMIFGPASAGMALIFLVGVDSFLPEHGLLVVSPSCISMGLAALFWGILIHHRGDVGGWILPMILIPMGIHTVGMTFAGITLGYFVALQGWPVRRRNLALFFMGVLLILFYYFYVMDSEYPLGFKAFASLVSKNGLITFRMEQMSFADVMRYVSVWMKLFGLGVFSFSVVLCSVLVLSVTKKRFELPLLLSALVALMLFFISYTNYAEGIFQRFWIVSSVLLTGIAAAFFLMVLDNLLIIIDKITGHNMLEHGSFYFSKRNIFMATAMISIVVIVYAYHINNIFDKGDIGNTNSIVYKYKKAVLEADYSFDPDQVRLLFDKDFPCNKVLYANVGDSYIDDGTWVMVATYLMYGALDCGALMYSMVHEPENIHGRTYLENYRDSITHAVFISEVHTTSSPLSVQSGKIQFKFLKEAESMAWRFSFNNPGPEEAVVGLRGIVRDGPYGEEVGQFILPPQWKGNVSLKLSQKVSGQAFGLILKKGTDVWLQGTRLGEEHNDLLWPWDQGLEMTFTNRVIWPTSISKVTRRTTRFTVSEMFPKFPISGTVIGDHGFSVLAKITP